MAKINIKIPTVPIQDKAVLNDGKLSVSLSRFLIELREAVKKLEEAMESLPYETTNSNDS